MIDTDTLFKIQYGMYIVTSKLNDKLNGQIATTVMQVSNDPIQLSVCLSNQTYTHEMVQQSKVFGVSILNQNTPMTFIGKFGYKSGRNTDKCAEVDYEQNLTGAPLIVNHALVVLECNVVKKLNLDTHTIFVGNLLSAKKIQDGIAMTYEYYHTELKGKAPETAPTYVKKKEKNYAICL